MTQVPSYLPPLSGVFSRVKAGRQEEEQTNKKVVESENLCNHGPLPAQSGHSKESSSQYCTRAGTCQSDSDGGPYYYIIIKICGFAH